MKSTILDKIKDKKPFEFNDIFIYLSLLVIVALLFLFFIILPQNNNPKGFKILIDNREVLTFDYQSEYCSFLEDYSNQIEIDENKNQITIFHNQEKNSYNVIKYDTVKGSVKMFDSTCSNTKDCVYEMAISINGAIYCAPHDLLIIPITNNSASKPPVLGGSYE